MDPNQALSDIRWIVRDLDENEYRGRNAATALYDLADMFNALDAWITKGGFLPTDWEKRQDKERATERGY
jgi:hypothetical protein